MLSWPLFMQNPSRLRENAWRWRERLALLLCQFDLCCGFDDPAFVFLERLVGLKVLLGVAVLSWAHSALGVGQRHLADALRRYPVRIGVADLSKVRLLIQRRKELTR